MKHREMTAIFFRSRRRSASAPGLSGRLSDTASSDAGGASSTASPAIADPRVDKRVHDVDEDAGDNEAGGPNHRYGHDHVVVAAVNRFVGKAAVAWNAGDCFDKEGALEDPEQREGEHRAQRQEGVPDNVTRHDAELADSLR